MNDWTQLILGKDNSQTAPVCNGQVREMIGEISQLRTDNEALMGAVKGVLDSMDKYDGGQADIGRVWIACAKLTGVYIAISGRGE